jgi:iron complex outermembrane receptor protein
MFTTTVRYTSDRVWYRTETDGAYPATKTVKYTLDSYWTVDLKVQQRIYDHWILSLQANNLFDKEYDTYFGTFTDQTTSVTTVNSYPGAGRYVFFSATFEY